MIYVNDQNMDEQKIKCAICGAEFESEAEHEEHMKNEHGSKQEEDKGQMM